MPVKQNDLSPSPFLKASLISKLFYWWLNDLFLIGNKRSLDLTDLYQALPDDRSKKLGDDMQMLWDKEVQRCDKLGDKNKPSLNRVIIKQFGKKFMMFGILAFIEECFTKVAQPVCLGYLIRYFSGDKSFTKGHGYLLAGGVVLGSVLYTFSHHPYFFGVQYIGMKVRIACCSLLYRKSLRLSQAALGETTIGQMTNLISNDVSRFDQCMFFIHYLWIGPIQTAIVTVLLWHLYGFGISCLAGISILLFFIPFQGCMGKLFSKLRSSTAEKTDTRIRIMNEIVNGIRLIKMYAWEKPFSEMVGQSREEEIGVIKRTNTLRAVNMSLFYASSKLIVFLTLLTYVLTDHMLTAEKVFVTLSLYNNVRLIMTLYFPFGISQLAEILVSTKRLRKFLLMEERPKISSTNSSRSTHSSYNSIGKGIIKMDHLYARWTKEQTTLSDISLKIGTGELVAVVGGVGSGKTALLQTILKELPPYSGTIRVLGTIAYTCQEPQVFSGSVKSNILFGRPFDEERYDEVVDACALKRDMDLFPYGDNTLVGDKGASLSGGQRARIGLARAVYSDADIYLLDDPLSAVDAEVGRFLFDRCICGFLKDKTRILVTHQLQLLKSVQNIVLLEDGRIKAQGNFDQISAAELEKSLQKVKTTPSKLKKNRSDSANSRSSLTRGSSSLAMIGNEIGWGSTFSINVDEFDEDYLVDDDEESEDLIEKESGDTINNTSNLLGSKHKNATQALNEETSGTGHIGLGLYISYFSAGTNCLSAFVLIVSNIVTQVLYTGSDWWLNFWTQIEEGGENVPASKASHPLHPLYVDKKKNIYIYSGFILALFIAAFIRTLLFFKVCMTASVNLHQAMFTGIIRSPMRFFELNPAGRILNRITKDIGAIDDSLPITMFDTIEIFLQVVGIITIVAIVSPVSLIPALLLPYFFYHLRKFYLRTARSLKRIEGNARSPVFSHLSTTLYGLTTIRAFKTESAFIKQFDDYQDNHTSTWYLFMSSTRWFGVYLDWISIFFIAFVTFSFLFWNVLNAEGAQVGLAVSSAMTLTGMLQWGVRQSAEVESQMVSVERVREYTTLEPEADLETPPGESPPPKDWPSSGEIVFDHVSLRYGNEEPILKNITFIIKPSEKIGIVGRTGAGKSSLISSLFRIAEPSGTIIIDKINVLKIGLHELRSKLTIIPQEPILFTGTMRRNLDPFNSYDDSTLWKVLEDVHLAHDVKQFASGLDVTISEGGSNFSVGQRQLVCLARAILKNNKLLILDEATSNMDENTDALIQHTIRTKFADNTTLTIAHRLITVIDCDRILVLDAGSILEFDEPYTLLQNKQSSLYSLAEQSGALETLIKIAKEAALNRRLASIEN